MGPKKPASTVLTPEEEAAIVTFRRYTLLPLDDCLYDRVCLAKGIDHRLTKIKHPWTNGQVERMNRTIKEATVKKYYYQTHEQLKGHMHGFLMAYNFARRLKTLKGLTPYEYICKIWTKEPERFNVDTFQHTVGLNN